MFCRECGKEIPDGGKFCCHCGTAAVDVSRGMQENMGTEHQDGKKEEIQKGSEEKRESEKVFVSKYKKVFQGVLLFFGTAFLFFGIREFLKQEDVAAISTREVQSEGSNLEDMDTEAAEEGERTKEEKREGEAEKSGETEEGTLMVSVPVDVMSLRKTPGLGADVIMELKAGTWLKWDGQIEVVDDMEFYKVVVRDTGDEGYVSGKYCIEAEYEADEAVLDLVEVDTALYTYDMMCEDIRLLCSRYPDRLISRVIGSSHDGREIYEVILGNPDASNHILVQAGIHGREYMTSQLMMKMLEYYAYYYDTGTCGNILYRELLERTAIHAVPMANPDGVTISQLGVSGLNDASIEEILYACYERDKETLIYEEDSNGDMNWYDFYRNPDYGRTAEGRDREITFEEYLQIWKANAHGVDLNNNFDAGWEEIQLKQKSAYGSYKGHAPVSEPETQALVRLAQEREYQCFLSYHSRGQLIYYDVAGNSPENAMASENFAAFMKSCIGYEPVNTNNAYNVNLGGFGDWVQLVLGKPSVTIETGKKPCPLTLDEFPAIWHRNRESWAKLCQQFY